MSAHQYNHQSGNSLNQNLKAQARSSILYANFQSSQVLAPNISQGVTVKFVQKKQVSFDLEKNEEFQYKRDEGELFTLEDKRQLSMLIWKNQQIQMQIRSGRIVEEDEDNSADENQIVVNVEPTPNIKGILKKDSNQPSVTRKKRVFTFEVEEEDNGIKQDKNLQTKENALVSKYDIGYHISLKQGFKIGQGLGKDGQGIQEPIQHIRKTEFTGEQTIQESKEEDQLSYIDKKWLKVEQKKKIILKKCNDQCYQNSIDQITNWSLDLENKSNKIKSECTKLENEIQDIDKDQQLAQKEYLNLKQQQSGLKTYLSKLSNNLNMINIRQLTLECRRLLAISPLMFMNLDFPQLFINLVKNQFKIFINQNPDKDSLLEVHENLSSFFNLLIEIMQTKRGFSLSIYSDQQIQIKSLDIKQYQHLQYYVQLIVQPLVLKFKGLQDLYNEEMLEVLKVWNQKIAEIEIELKEASQSLKLIPDSLVQELFTLTQQDLESNGVNYFENNKLFINILAWQEVVPKQQISDIVQKIVQNIFEDIDPYNTKYAQELKRVALLLNKENYNQLILRKLMPRICRAIQQIEINPGNQDIQQLKQLEEWHPCLNENQLDILNSVLLDNIKQIFDQWKNQQYFVKEEIEHWLRGWKELFKVNVDNLINKL